jgi:16S rRNA (uracil1498-N3)-methyltransferase
MTQTKIYTLPRLHVNDMLEKETQFPLSQEQSHYLSKVMRCRIGDRVRLFNGKDGEWLGAITSIYRNQVELQLLEQLKTQEPEPDIWLVFAPLKNERMHFLIEKATELGASSLVPVITERSITTRVNIEKMTRYAEEAAEQSERLNVPSLHEILPLGDLLAHWPAERALIFCDESGSGIPLHEALKAREPRKCAVLIGPEGGFTKAELEQLHQLPYVIPVGLGPRILRADTAALVALAGVQMFWGDWHKTPRFITSN